MHKSALAIAAHPDDIEFAMAGTLLLLKSIGYEIHYLNVANGNCGSVRHNRARTKVIRAKEARLAAHVLGAHYYPSLTNDLEIFYEPTLLRQVAAAVRKAQPNVILTHSPLDYMEDHTNTCRLAVTAAFTRSMPNFATSPPLRSADYELTIYHAMPHGFCDQLRRKIVPGLYVNTTSVQKKKMQALACHKSQQDWLELSQGMNSYLQAMEEASLRLGRMSGRYRHAEGWRRHLHYGYCSAQADPLATALKKYSFINRAYEHGLTK